MATAIIKIGACVVNSATNNSSSTMESFWKNQTCVITFFRRMGCKFCRLEAVNLSRLKPAFDKRGIKLIGITFDEAGAPEFLNGGYFSGDLYFDRERSTYKSLNYARVSGASGFFSIFTKAGKKINSQAKTEKISGNFTGDGWQTGGLLVVEKGGKILYNFEQKQVVNHPDYFEIMRVLNIKSDEVPEYDKLSQNMDGCSENACSL